MIYPQDFKFYHELKKERKFDLDDFLHIGCMIVVIILFGCGIFCVL